MKKDKSRRNIEQNQFQLRSRLFFIYPEYGNGSKNFDICLIKMPANEYGVLEDMSSQFESIPCLPEEIDFEKVYFNSFKIKPKK